MKNTTYKIQKYNSFKVFPQKERRHIRKSRALHKRGDITNEEMKALEALRVSEMDLREVLGEVDDIIKEAEKRREIMFKRGYILYNDPVLPESAGFTVGFEEVKYGDNSMTKQVYRKEGLYMWHIQDSMWVVKGKAWSMPIVMNLPSMADFITCMKSLGIEINVDEVMNN